MHYILYTYIINSTSEKHSIYYNDILYHHSLQGAFKGFGNGISGYYCETMIYFQSKTERKALSFDKTLRRIVAERRGAMLFRQNKRFSCASK
jgi:hypothetical protein